MRSDIFTSWCHEVPLVCQIIILARGQKSLRAYLVLWYSVQPNTCVWPWHGVSDNRKDSVVGSPTLLSALRDRGESGASTLHVSKICLGTRALKYRHASPAKPNATKLPTYSLPCMPAMKILPSTPVRRPGWHHHAFHFFTYPLGKVPLGLDQSPKLSRGFPKTFRAGGYGD